MKLSLNKKDYFFLYLQIFINWLMMPILGHLIIGILKFIRHNKVRNLKEIRKRYRTILKDKKPTLICANHLTFVDSIIIHHAVNSVMGFFWNFKSFSWNIPAIENFKGSLPMIIVTYLGKCIPIDRHADASHHQKVLDKLRFLMLRGDVCTIFPEGTRSRTGVVETEQVTYGVGNIVKDFEEYRILCMYTRGDHQLHHTVFPSKRDSIYVALEDFYPSITTTGMRAARDISVQVIRKIKEMEDVYLTLGYLKGTPSAKGEKQTPPL